jgi:hypothetical protein
MVCSSADAKTFTISISVNGGAATTYSITLPTALAHIHLPEATVVAYQPTRFKDGTELANRVCCECNTRAMDFLFWCGGAMDAMALLGGPMGAPVAGLSLGLWAFGAGIWVSGHIAGCS